MVQATAKHECLINEIKLEALRSCKDMVGAIDCLFGGQDDGFKEEDLRLLMKRYLKV